MSVLFDTNVVLDLLLDREPFATTAAQLLTQVEQGALAGYLCATTLTTIAYLTGKARGADQARQELAKLLAFFEVAPVNRAVLEAALTSRVTDFEDAVVHEAAVHVGAQGIVTRNPQDFKRAKLRVYSPEELQGMLRSRLQS